MWVAALDGVESIGEGFFEGELVIGEVVSRVVGSATGSRRHVLIVLWESFLVAGIFDWCEDFSNWF